MTKRYLTSFLARRSQASLMLSVFTSSMSQVKLCLPHTSSISCVSFVDPVMLPLTDLLPALCTTNKKAKEKNTCFTVPYSITYESTKLQNVNLPNIRGKAGSSIGWSGAHTTANVPFTLSNSSVGPRECLADTVSTIKSRVLLAACHPKNTSSYLFILYLFCFF